MSLSCIELRDLLTRTLTALPTHAEELRELDAALGDGDLGITVQSGSAAVVKAIGALFAALIGGGLLAASKAVTGKDAIDKADSLAIGRAVAARIIERGKSQVGDKTVLDALVPSLDTLEATSGSTDAVLDAMIAKSREQVTATASQQSKKGRAAWVQERSIGHADPGATAYLRFLEALRSALQA
jgi:dihydroxyacetone kinase-like protein